MRCESQAINATEAPQEQKPPTLYTYIPKATSG